MSGKLTLTNAGRAAIGSIRRALRHQFYPNPYGSFWRACICGGHSSAKTPVACALSGLAPRVRTPVFADGVQDTKHVPLGVLAAGQGGRWPLRPPLSASFEDLSLPDPDDR